MMFFSSQQQQQHITNQKKKWRRIKRLSPLTKDLAAEEEEEDACQLLLKRALSASTPQNIINPANTTHTLPPTLSGIEASFAGAGGTDSSESSTATSAPKVKLWPAVSGYGQDKNRMKNLIANNVATSNGEVRRGKSVAKKLRGQSIGKENSQSSLESDSRSSNSVFTQAAFSATSNGKQGGRSVNYDEAYNTSQQLSQDDSTAGSAWNDNKVKGDDLQIHDPLLQSIHAFHSVQEALEKEVRKLGAIGCVPVDSTFMESSDPSSSDPLVSEKTGETASGYLEAPVLMMTQKVESLESRLEEAKDVLAMKDTQIAEMETIINRCKLSPSKDESAESQREKLRVMEVEFDGLFQQKMEAEIEYLALTRATQKLKVAAINQRKFVFEGQKSLISSNQGHALEEAEEEKVEEDIKGILKMRRRVCKISFCFFVQLVLWLVVVLELYQPHSDLGVVVVPT